MIQTCLPSFTTFYLIFFDCIYCSHSRLEYFLTFSRLTKQNQVALLLKKILFRWRILVPLLVENIFFCCCWAQKSWTLYKGNLEETSWPKFLSMTFVHRRFFSIFFCCVNWTRLSQGSHQSIRKHNTLPK